MQQLPDKENTDSRPEGCCQNSTKIQQEMKNFLNYQTDTDKLNCVSSRSRNKVFLYVSEMALTITFRQDWNFSF